MSPDGLRKLVNERDKALARPHRLEPQRLVLAARGDATTRLICLGCRCVPYEREWSEFLRRYDEATTPLERERLTWPKRHEGVDCPACGGQLVEITA